MGSGGDGMGGECCGIQTILKIDPGTLSNMKGLCYNLQVLKDCG